MQDVDTRVQSLRLLDEVGDGRVLGVARAGGEEVGVARAAVLRGGGEVAGVLRVDDQQTVEGGDLGEGAGQLLRAEVRELVDAGG